LLSLLCPEALTFRRDTPDERHLCAFSDVYDVYDE
jgi:hypothetical protein